MVKEPLPKKELAPPQKIKKLATLSKSLNPLVPGIQNRNPPICHQLTIISIVKRLVCLNTHYSERQ